MRLRLPQVYVYNLGVFLDSLLEQVAAMTRKAFAQLHLGHQLNTFLDLGKGGILVTPVMVTSQLEYCNELFMRLLLKTSWKLQLVQNAVVQAVMGRFQYAHATTLLCELHWLSVCSWVLSRALRNFMSS